MRPISDPRSHRETCPDGHPTCRRRGALLLLAPGACTDGHTLAVEWPDARDERPAASYCLP